MRAGERGRRRRRLAWPGIALLAACPLIGGCSALGHADDVADTSVRGPLAARPEHPLAATWLSFPPRRAATAAPGHGEVGVEASYASFFESRTELDRSVVVDGEILTVTGRARLGVGEDADIEVGLPFQLAGPGFLDAFIEGWHEFFDLPDGNRDSRPQNLYEVNVHVHGRDVYDLEGGELLLGDVPLIWTQRLVREGAEHAGVSMRLGVELPTGDASLGAGNGEFDWGGGLLVERSLGRYTFTGAADYVITGQSDMQRHAGVDADDQWDLQGAVEYRWNECTSLLAGFVLNSPMLTDVDLQEVEHLILDLGLGAAWTIGQHSRWSFSFHEDLISHAGPDFGVVLVWTYVW